MKNNQSIWAMMLILSILITGCVKATAEPTQVPTSVPPVQEPTKVPTKVPTEVPTAIPTEAEPIKLGVIVSLGDISGINGQNGALLAQEEINAAGGILGRPLEVIVMDDEMTPEKGAAAVEKLVTVDNVDAFVINSFSGVHMAQIPTLKKYGTVTIVTGAASHLCEEAIGTDADWYFHLHSWDYMQGQGQKAGWLAITEKYPDLEFGSVFMAYEEGAFGTASFQFSQVLFEDMATLSGESFKSAAMGGGDYSAVLEHAKAENADSFTWVGYAADALPILEQAKAINYAPPFFVGAPPGWPPDFGDSPLSEGVIAYEVWADALTEVSDVSKDFYDSYVDLYGSGPDNYLAALVYSAVHILAEGMERAGTLEADALITALEETEYVAPTMEVITFSPSMIIKHQAPLTPMIAQYQGGELEVLYPWDRATSELIYPFPSWEGR